MIKRLSKILILFVLIAGGTLFGQSVNSPKAKTISVTYPNGGELWLVGSSKTILWTSTEISNVSIQYSIDGGTSWTTIASNVVASLGKYTWNIDSTTVSPSQETRIRIVDSGGSGVSDASNANFTLSELRIDSPISGSVFQTGRATAIRWFASSDISTIAIQYSANGGSSWTNIASGINANDNQYLWNVNVSSSNQAKIRIYDENNPATIIATSPDFITADLSLTAPNGGEEWRAGETEVISWNSSFVTYVKLEYSVDGGTWTEIADSIQGGVGTYSWLVPDELSNQAMVRISYSGDAKVYDQSSSTFTILNLQITSPDGGEGWEIGSTAAVTWATNLSGNVDIDLSTDGGTTYSQNIAANIPAGTASYTFTVPNLPTGEARIRISSSANSSVLDESAENFTIGTVTISQPVGGENWMAGSAHQLSWSSTSGIEVISMDYTTDNGATWNVIRSAYPASYGSYYWYIPNGISGNSVKIRMYDAATGIGKTHLSNPISIATLQITSPLNGAIYKWGDNVVVNWTASSNVGNVSVEYSADGGSNYTLIQNNIASGTGTYTWTIPNGLASDQMKIRVRDESNSDFANTNPGYFTIGNISVLTPNGGEKIVGGIYYPITWTATNSIGNVRIEYSTDGGATYTNIPGASSRPASDGAYNWYVPNIATTNARIRISDATTANIIDASDNDFTIGILQLTSPNGGEGYAPNQNVNITWNAQSVSQVMLEYTTDGSNWTQIATGVDATLGSYAWTVPTDYTNQAIIRISDFSNPANYDMSDSYFSIGKITVTSPNGSEIYQTGKTYNITYDYSSNITSVNIELSTDNGVSWSPIASNISATGTYSWSIGSTPSANALIRVLDATFNDVSDMSDNSFAIEQLDLVSPNGSNYFMVDSAAAITWNSSQVNNIKIEYSTDNGAIWQTVVASTPAAPQSYAWTIPNTPSTNTLVRLSDADNSSFDIADTSDNVFTINLLYMLSPNGGENYIVNDNIIIRWLAHSSLSTVRLEYSTNNGSSWNQIAAGVTASDKQYSWIIPNTPTNQALVRIIDEANSSVSDQSNSEFSIGSIILTSPNGGEKWQVDSVKTITWQNIATISNVDLSYSVNGGTSWNLISSNVTGSAERYDWTVPDSVTSTALIRIENSADSSMNDESDNTFSIAKIVITSPNGGEILQAGNELPILWNSYNVDRATIQYSIDNGATWTTIDNNVQASLGQYNWTIPSGLSTGTFLIRIFDNNFNTVHDISDAAADVYYLEVSSPNGNEAWNIGSTENITWNSSGISNVDLFYSADLGATWTSIASSVDGTLGTYGWAIPSSVASDSMLIRIVDSNHSSVRDSSDSRFAVGNIDITSPVSSTVWQTGSVQPIKWTAEGVETVLIEISFDGGATWATTTNSYGAGAGVYYYNVPNNSTASAEIRLTDTRTGSHIVETSQTFTINNLSITYPTSASLWMNGSTYGITWNSSNIANVNLKYSTDDGVTWTDITASTPASTGSYNWTVPNGIATNKARIKILDVDNNSAVDSTDNFTIGNIVLNAPTTTDVWQSGKSYKIKWAASSGISEVNVDYSSDNGATWNTVQNNVSAADSSLLWTVPASMSTSSARIRVYDVNSSLGTNDQIVVQSSAFKLVNLNLTSPTSTSNWQARSSHNITWSGSSLINTVTLSYSRDLGSTWTTIAPAVNFSTGSYSWTLPDLTSDSVLVKIASDTNPWISDSMSSPFKISDLAITNISTSTEWQSGTAHTISWTSENLSNIDIQYSLDNGSTWNNIISGISASNRNYLWNIPSNISSAQALVRISSSSDPTIYFDTPLFTIKYLRITSPNGGENWQVGNNETITWNSGLVSNVKIDLSTDNGSSWINISTPIAASNGSYTWNVPDSISTVSALIRLIDLDNTTIRDSSDANFTIGRLVLTSPLGGEEWQEGSTHNITWSSINVNNVQLEYSSDNGTTWNRIVSPVNANAHSYSWTIPSGISSTSSLVRITSLDDPTVTYTSNIFTINQLSVVSPNGREILQSGSQIYLKWQSSNIANINIYFSSDNGTTWSEIVSNFNASADSLAWTVPNNVSTDLALIKVVDSSDSTHYDVSDNVFSIHSFQLTSPIGGEVWQVGKSYNITWNASSNILTVSLDYSIDNGTTWNNVAQNVDAALGTYSWSIPSGSSSNRAKIRLSDDNSTITYTSGIFTIEDLQLTSPIGGEFWTSGTTENITWTSSQITNVRIEYSSDNGTNWETLSNSESAAAGTYAWNIPVNYSTSNGLIRISDADNSDVNSVSDNKFTLGKITVLYPNGGEVLQAGEKTRILWNSLSSASLFNIDYSTDNGATWNSIAVGTDSASSFTWQIPDNIYTSSALVRVTDALSSGAIGDQSDGAFTINMLKVVSPNGGEDFKVGSTQNIAWSSGSNISNVKLEYYTPQTGWENIVSSVAANSSPYLWTVPNIPSDSVKIRIVSTADNTIADVSDSVFRIGNLNLTSPLSSTKWQSGDNITISWNNSANVSKVNLFYKIGTAGTWTDIGRNINASDGAYNWTIPAINTQQLYLRIEDAEAVSSIYDETGFTITVSNLAIITPNISTVWIAGATENILWNSSSDVAKIKILYSIDRGTTWNSITDSITASVGKYSWAIPNSINSDSILVRVEDIDFSNVDDTSEYFKISNAQLTLTSPNGGEYWQAGKDYSVKWNITSNISLINIYYSVNGGNSWSLLQSNYPASNQSFDYSLPANLSTDSLRIKIEDASNTFIADSSSQNTYVRWINLIAPIGGEHLQANRHKTVSWNASGNMSNVRVDFSADGTIWNSIATVNAASGSYDWLINNIPTDSGYIRVSDANSNLGIVSTSGPFAVSMLNLTGPINGGEYQTGDSLKISWINSADISSVQMEYSTDNTNWYAINSTPAAASDSSYIWVIDNSVCGDSVYIRLIDFAFQSIADTIPKPITIKHLQLVEPAAGANWRVGTTHQIKWQYCGIDSLQIQYSLNKGISWIDVASVAATDLQYNWLIPNTTDDSVKVRIADKSNGNIKSESGYFTIYQSLANLTYPNGSEFLRSGDSLTVTWSSSLVNYFKIDFSSDNGSTWTTISNATAASADSFRWAIPDTLESNQCLVKITDLENPSVSDSSDNVFTIAKLKLTKPIGGEYISAGTILPITWDVSSSISGVKLSYSLDNGRIWSGIQGASNITASVDTFMWNVPNNLCSDSALIKIASINHPQINDISKSFITGWVKVNSPNGGEVYLSGKNMPITWSNCNSVKQLLIEVIDGKTNLTLHSEIDSSASGSVNITLPSAVVSDSVLIRISDVRSNYQIIDSSDSYFTISRLEFTSPNSSTNWNSGSQHLIEWNSGDFLGNLNLEYSLNNGQTWNTIQNSVASSRDSLTWQLPADVNSNSCLVRGYNPNINTVADTSDKFTIFTSQLALISPNGGEKLEAGSQYNIKWSSAFITNIQIEVSYDNGSSWDTLTTSAIGDDSLWTWNVPPEISTEQGLIRLRNTIDSSQVVTSASPFSIGWIKVTSPSLGSHWIAGRSDTIAWDASASVHKVNLLYSLSGNTADSNLVLIDANVNANDSIYVWRLPLIESPNAKIVILDPESNNLIKSTSGAIKISKMLLLSPNGNEFIQAGAPFKIEWNVTSETIPYVNVDYTLNGGTNWARLATSVHSSDSSYLWNIGTGISSDSALVRISDAVNNSLADTSDKYFSIGGLELTVFNSPEKVLVGTTKKVTWSRTNNIAKVNLYYKTSDGVWKPFAQNYPADSAYFNWTIPDDVSDSCFVKISDENNPLLYDISNAPFIISNLKIVNFNGGNVYQTGKTHEITWSSSFISFVNIQYSTDSLNWTNINQAPVVADSGKVEWAIPDDINYASPNYLLRIVDSDYPNIADTSNSTFTVSYIKMKKPNGGEGEQIGTSYTIEWASSSNTISHVNLYVELQSGSDVWTPIANNIDAASGSYYWLIETQATPSARMKVEDADNHSIFDISDSTFVISHIQLTSPNGGQLEKLQVGNTYEIAWESKYINNVGISYSVNGGSTWNFIGAAVGDSGKYNWTVPNVPTDQARIKLQDFDYANVYDVSDTNFSIVSINVLTPNNYVAINSNSTYNITWTSNYLDSVRILLSTDGGSSYPILVGLAPGNAGSYTWTTPNLATADARIKITDIYQLDVHDVSDTTFLIGLYPTITPIGNTQSGVIKFLYSLPNANESVDLSKFSFRAIGGSENDGYSYLQGDYQNLVGPLVDTIKWNSKGQLDNFEGKVVFNATFHSTYRVDYQVATDTILIDNKAPQFNPSSFKIEQNSFTYGWSKAVASWDAAIDSSRPINYELFVSENSTFDTIPSAESYGTQTLLQNLKTSTTYNYKMKISDSFGNSTVFNKTSKTKALADFNADGQINGADLAAYVFSWSSPDSSVGADMYPYSGTTPIVTVTPDDNLNINDLIVFQDMWNYYAENRGLPKSVNYNFDDADSRESVKFKKGENKFDFNIDLKRKDLTAVSAEIHFNPAVFKIDSLKFIPEDGTTNNIVFAYQDTVKGVVRIDFSNLSGKVGSEYSIISKIRTELDRDNNEDSLLIVYKGYDKHFNQAVSGAKVYTLQEVPNKFMLYQNYPNPYNPTTTIEFDVASKSKVSLKVYNILGQEVATIINKVMEPGSYKTKFNAFSTKTLASGVYFYRIVAGKYVSTKKMLLLK